MATIADPRIQIATQTLFQAIENRDERGAKKALADGADVESIGGMCGDTPLIVAASKSNLAIVQLLLAHGAEVEKKHEGRTAVHASVAHGKARAHCQFFGVSCARNGGQHFIVEAGADVTGMHEFPLLV